MKGKSAHAGVEPEKGANARLVREIGAENFFWSADQAIVETERRSTARRP